MINKIKFGTGGWREIIGESFTRENVQKIAYACLENVDEKGIIISYDRRFISQNAAKWISEVMCAYGKTVFLVNRPIPTPVTMFSVKNMDLSCGLVVTASHNPSHYNGIKVISKGGVDADLTTTRKIEDIANSSKEIKAINIEKSKEKGLYHEINPMNDYVDSILNIIDEDVIRKAKFKLILDPMHGVSKTALSTILYSCRCEIDLINDNHDAFFGGQLPSPSLDTLSRLKEILSLGSYDLGIATDGDADRIGIIDEKGRFIHPSILIALIYRYLLEEKKLSGPAVRNLTTSHIIDAIAKKHNQEVIEVKVGFKNISEAMEKYNALIGGESSGGFTVSGHIMGKDGIFAAVLILEMLAVSGKKMSELTDSLFEEYGEFHTAEKDYHLKVEEIRKTEIKLEDFLLKNSDKNFKVIRIDGLKLEYPDGSWVCVRKSGTEPLLRVISEASTASKADNLINKIENIIF